MSITVDLARKNQKTLQQLAQAMALSRGQFKLILVRCNYGDVCQRWSEELTQTCQQQHQFSLTAAHLPPHAQNLVQAIQAVEPFPPDGLQLLGLNQLADVRQFLANSNQIRDRLRRNCPFPIAIWLDDNSLKQMLKVANDLHSWTTSKHFSSTLDDLQQQLRHLLEAFFQRLPHASPDQWLGSQPLLSQSEQRELDLAQSELNGHLSPSLQGDLAIIQSHQHLVQQNLSLAKQQLEQGAKFWQNISPPTANSQKRLGWVAFQQAILSLWESEQQQHSLNYPDLHPLKTQFQESQQHFQAATEPDLAHLVANAAVVQLVNGLTEITHPETSSDPAQVDHLAAVNEQLCQQESFPFPNLWLKALEQLHHVYFQDRQDYRRAFSIQQQQWQVQRYGGQRAFVGASRLQGILYQRCSLDNLPPEIKESGREEDVRHLQERLSGTQSKILVIHGQSGVGKSSLVNAGLLPVLREKTFTGGREGVPILLRLYQPWTEKLEAAIDQTSQRHKKSLAGIPQGSSQQRIKAKLLALEKQHCQVILVFDQFEEFFFANPSQQDHEAFFEFIGQLCSNIQQLGALKVVFSLRTDYVGPLLLCNDLESMDCINRDILSRQVLHKLGNLSAQQTSQVLEKLAPHLKEDLRTRLVADLSQEMGAVRPIELQLIGFQLESDGILSLTSYEQLGDSPQEMLIERYLDDIVRACGIDYQTIANGVLYLLTDERGTRPLQTRENLWDELQRLPRREGVKLLNTDLNLVLEIFTASGLVVIVPGKPECYQLVHDYLSEFIYKSRSSDLLAALEEERSKRISAEDLLAAFEEERSKRISAENDLKKLEIQTQLAKLDLEKIQVAAEMEDDCRSALLKFVSHKELEALIDATKTAFYLRERIKHHSDYSTNQPIKILNKILRDIRIKNEIEGHLLTVQCVDFNSSGTFLISSSRDQKIKIWDIKTGKKVRCISGHTDWVNSAHFSPDGKMIVSGSRDQKIKLWNFTTGEELYCFYGHTSSVRSAIFSPDGTKVASGSRDSTVRLWDVKSGKELKCLNGHTSWVWGVDFSPDGTMIASASQDSTVMVWDVKTGKEIYCLHGHGDWVNSAHFSPNGKMLVSASDDGTIKLWDVESGKNIRSITGHSRGVNSASFNSDGKMIVSASGDRTVRLWDVNSGEELQVFYGHSDSVKIAKFNPDDTILVSASSDRKIKVWDLEKGEELKSLHGHSNFIRTASFSPDGTKVVSASHDRTVKVWDVTIGEEIYCFNSHTSWVRDASFSPDGTMIVSSSHDRTIKIWDSISGREIAYFCGHTSGVNSSQFSPNSKLLVSAARDGMIKLWDIENGCEIGVLQGHSDSVWSVAFSPDGTVVVSASRDGTIKMWDLDTHREIVSLYGHVDSVNSASFSPDGQILVSTSTDRSIKLWDVSTGEEIFSLEGHTNSVNSATFSPDGTKVVSGSDDRTVKIWSTVTGEELSSFHSHLGPINSVNFSPDGTKVVSGSDDRTVKIWDVTGSETLHFIENNSTSGSADGIVKLSRKKTLDELLDLACDWLRPYLTSNPNVTEADQALCNIPPPETPPTD